MSKIANIIKNEDVSFVLPYASKMRYTKIGKRDKALCFIINKGYIESSSLEACYYFSVFLDNTLANKFLRVGDIDKIVSKCAITYRQRVYFTDLALLLQILNRFKVRLNVLSSFRIGISQMSDCADSVACLDMYFNDKKRLNYTLDDWLTNTCLLQLYIACKLEGLECNLYRDIDVLLSDGLLNRAPYLCGSYDKKLKCSTIIIPPTEMLLMKKSDGTLVDLLSDYLEDKHVKYTSSYSLWNNGVRTKIYGFTTHNIELDARVRG